MITGGGEEGGAWDGEDFRLQHATEARHSRQFCEESSVLNVAAPPW